jgi:hypothetical protein
MAAGLRYVKTVRAISAVLTLGAVGVVGLVAAEQGGTLNRHTTVTRHEVAPKTAPTPSPSTSAAAPTAATPSDPEAALTGPATVPTATPVVPTAAPAAVATAAVSSPLSDPPASGTTPPAPVANVLPACPLPLPAPAVQGGLQSLIPFAPVFGPFSAEAFASAATFQPLLELFGPFLVDFAQQYAAAQPEVTPLLLQLEALENQGYALLAPFYAPYREQFLTAETNLATALAPVASSLVENPASACIVDFEGWLTAAH